MHVLLALGHELIEIVISLIRKFRVTLFQKPFPKFPPFFFSLLFQRDVIVTMDIHRLFFSGATFEVSFSSSRIGVKETAFNYY